ncbi:hypothetical protein B0H13DRAFT_975699 [Mycena leptocephala]|nr:hypothetical protein B0H13DRAFT_975699 [Mycena leptocephala]
MVAPREDHRHRQYGREQRMDIRFEMGIYAEAEPELTGNGIGEGWRLGLYLPIHGDAGFWGRWRRAIPAPFILCSLSQASYFAFLFFGGPLLFLAKRFTFAFIFLPFLLFLLHYSRRDSVLPCELDGPPPLVSSFLCLSVVSFRRLGAYTQFPFWELLPPSCCLEFPTTGATVICLSGGGFLAYRGCFPADLAVWRDFDLLSSYSPRPAVCLVLHRRTECSFALSGGVALDAGLSLPEWGFRLWTCTFFGTSGKEGGDV